MTFAAEWGVGEVLLTMIYFVFLFIWIWLLIMVFADIFRSHDLSGWAKAAWVIGIVLLPYLGVFVYLIARGHKMSEHAAQAAKAQDEALKAYVRDAAGSSGDTHADQLQKLADLKGQGVIDDAEFAKLKAKIVT